MPDGYYLLKLVASDRPSRPGSEAMADERVSVPVLIDNRGPGILQDEFGSIMKIEVSRNSGDWETVFPDDGLLDSPQETFRYATGVLPPGEHVFVFAAADAHENPGSGKIVVQAAGKAR